MRLPSAIVLFFIAISVTAQLPEIKVTLTPNGGPPGTVVTVDLVQGGPFTPNYAFNFSFGDDLGSVYSRVPTQFTLVSPSQVTFTVPDGADCGTHYFAVRCPSSQVCFRTPAGRTPFEVTGSCNPARRNALDVLTYNLMLLPDIICGAAGAPCRNFGCFFPSGSCGPPVLDPGCAQKCACEITCGKDTRVDLMGTHPDLRPHDVIVFQEAFSDSHRQDLREALRGHYAHQTSVLGRDGFLSENGGVMIFSKWPIEEVRNFIYPKLGCTPFDIFDPECRADKGVQYARINKGGQRHHIFGTHTNAFNVALRLNQLFEMQEFIDRTLPGLVGPGEPVIMAGDFNIDFYLARRDYDAMLGILRAINPAAQPLVTNGKSQWLDYVLYHRNYAQPSSASAFVVHPRDSRSPFEDGHLSDHYAVLGRFTFNSPGTPPPPPPDDDGGDDGGGPGCTVTKPTERPVLGGPSGCFASPANPTFSWSSVARAAEYKLAIFETTDPANETLVFYEAVPGTSFTLPFSLAPEKRYRWKVKGQNCAGPGLFSDMKWFTLSSDCSPPATAPVLSGPAGCVDAVRPTFSWSRVPKASDYRIVVSPASHDDFFIDKFTSELALASPVAINPQIPHRFKVRGVNDAGPGPWSDIMYFTTFCNGVAPTITEPVGCISTQTPTFTWDSIPPAVNYWLLVGDSPDFSAGTTTRLIDVHLTGTSFATPPGVSFAPQKTYYAKVKTILDPSSTTAAAWSTTVAFTPLCLPNDSVVLAHSIPTMMAIGRSYNASVTMKNTGQNVWTSVADYRLGSWAGGPWHMSSVELPGPVLRDQQVTFNFTVTAPRRSGPHVSQWRMQQGVEWFGQITTPIAVDVYAARPAAPTLVAPANCTTTLRPTFTWNAPAHATRYQIGVTRADVDNWFVNQPNITATSYTATTDLLGGVQYRWKVRACNDIGCGAWSPSTFFKPQCGSVTSITSPLGCIATQVPVFTWVAMPGAIDYWLLVGNSPDFSAATTTRYVDVHTTATSYAPGITFSPTTTYYAKVKTIAAAGYTTAWSTTISFSPLCQDTSPP